MCRASTRPPPDNVVPLPGVWWLWPYIKHFHRLIWESKLQLFADSHPRTQEEFRRNRSCDGNWFCKRSPRSALGFSSYILTNIEFFLSFFSIMGANWQMDQRGYQTSYEIEMLINQTCPSPVHNGWSRIPQSTNRFGNKTQDAFLSLVPTTQGQRGWNLRVIKLNWMQESQALLICMGGPRHWITCQRASHCSTMQLCHCLVSPTCKPSFQYQWVPAADNTSLPFCQDFWRSARISNCSASALWESSSWKEVAQNSSHFIMKDCRWIETYF